MISRILLLAALLLCSSLSLAHKPSDSYLLLNTSSASTTINGRWDIALQDLHLLMPLDLDGDGAIRWGELRHRQDAIAATVLPALTLSAMQGDTATPCPLQLTELQVNQHVDGPYAALHLQASCAQPPARLAIDYDLLFERDPSHHGLLQLQFDQQTLTTSFSDSQRQQTLGADAHSRWQSLLTLVGQGVHHILIGYDHILFLLTLLLPTVLVRQQNQWQPATSLKSVLGQTFVIVTAFTLAHSLTLALATLQVVNLPSRWVEATIAFTVMVGAFANLQPRFFSRRWLMALVFGLVHGFGFASVLADLGLTDNGILLPLLGFNLGVELGQLAIVLVFVPIAFLLRTRALYRQLLMPAGSLAIMALAGLWLVERLS